MLGLIFLGVTILDLALAAFFFFRTRSFLERAVSTTGTVTGYATSAGSEGGTMYHAIVRYQTVTGETHEFSEHLGSNPPSFEKGETVPVKYDPERPEKARIATAFRLWLIPGVLGVSGVGFAVAAAILLAAGK